MATMQLQNARLRGVRASPHGRRLAAPRAPVAAGPSGNVKTRAAAVASGTDWAAVAKQLEPKSPLEVMDHALSTFGADVGIAFSGAEDVALVEYAHLTGRPYRVFSLDTGRLNPETYRLFDKVEKHYGIRIEYTFPDAVETMELVRTKGLFSFYEDGHTECCRVRKVRPLRRQLKTLKAWITGQRKDQSPGTRAAVPTVEVDPAFEGVAGGPGSLIKYNPLTNMTSAEVWNFLRVMGVPTNELHERGYVSIGCEPCTRPVLPNQHEREGRWWWEDATAKECGLHSGNVKGGGEGAGATGSGSAVDGGGQRTFERDLWLSGAVAELSADEARELAAPTPRERDTLLVVYAPWCRFCQALEPAYEELAQQLKGSHVRVAKYRGDVDREFVGTSLQTKSFPTILVLPRLGGPPVKYPSERRDVESLAMWVKTLAGTA